MLTVSENFAGCVEAHFIFDSQVLRVSYGMGGAEKNEIRLNCKGIVFDDINMAFKINQKTSN